MKQKFNTLRVVVTVAILFVLAVVNAYLWKLAQIEAISPAGRALSEKNPRQFKQELKEHRDAQKAEQP